MGGLWHDVEAVVALVFEHLQQRSLELEGFCHAKCDYALQQVREGAL